MKKWVKKYLIWFAILLFVAIGFLWPLPKYIEGPGDAANLSKIVNIQGHPDRQKGQFMLMSVSISQARPFTYLYAKLSPYYSIEPEEDVTGGQDMKEYSKVQQIYMDGSINSAIYTAYHQAHKAVKIKYSGIYVMSLMKNSNFKNKLKVGDVVVALDGHHFKSSLGFIKYVKQQKYGQKLTVTYKRHGKLHQATAPLGMIAKHRAGIGITLTDDVQVKPKIPIKVHPGQVGGPSGGLMFALQIYSQLTNKNLRHGQKVAGTGTVDGLGNVGEIGGIDKKVITAKKHDAKIFLAPYVKPTKTILKYEEGHQTNYQLAKATAKKYAPSMKVIPVKTFAQAVSILEKNQ
ncbi:SepM family pheromone-processing serine protease [Lentilactobacillus buchneri]|uniref:Endopeptidase La n=1 Tax=Lentilactobacillus buchneri DSM 20057 TaxID=1423728 RepID=A0A4V3A3Z5_LENBU|nr:SepM family pheromone-processing serine protease [Lentilactobacillus buchneri]WCJ51482.1 PDZ domain-containing protein [Lentilactobacillus sp. Egmn17]AEB73011.1 Lon-like protease [Lentilactobacillus buchneri NRRL B-30929]KRK68093.1 Lon-like protease [Lentilactobacillus buchneri DSM 20057]MCT2882779.1 PDZ domain-containing protein [Lentilactobacillus buchneri]MCT2897683.1 PDZ domain-containing protein [Lentilactobacillus buchneri]